MTPEEYDAMEQRFQAIQAAMDSSGGGGMKM